MKSGNVILAVVAILFGGCLYIHRRVIKSLITGEEMPKAPAWHTWVPEDKRRSRKQSEEHKR